MMDHQRAPRQSASHGTLRGTYLDGHARPLHKPLRSVNESSSFLHSPGALESMLKTTTETGDIGVFSIKPTRNTPRLQVPRANANQPTPLTINELYGHPRSHGPAGGRDLTAEILSMYGTNSQSSVTSTLPSSGDDGAGRSFSLTTCGSRKLSRHQSLMTLQSQTSSSTLQRPRSPFPYPTRLKRPGARPASPAITENGLVDYSRMVQIDRISLRTGQRPLRQPYPPAPRGIPPLGARDVNRSTPTLRGPHYASRRAPASLRPASAASHRSYGGPARKRLDSVSSRAPSIRLAVGAYKTIPASPKDFHLDETARAPQYYDYTEEFEGKEGPPPPRLRTVAPVPTRDLVSNRPFVLREGSEEQLAALGEETDSSCLEISHLLNDLQKSQRASPADPVTHDAQQKGDRLTATIHDEEQPAGLDLRKTRRSSRHRQNSDINRLPSQVGRGSVDTFDPDWDVEAENLGLYEYPQYHAASVPKATTASPRQQVQILGSWAPTIRSEQGVILRRDSQVHAEESSVEEIEMGFCDGELQERPQETIPNARSHQTSADPARPFLAQSSGPDQHSFLPATSSYQQSGAKLPLTIDAANNKRRSREATQPLEHDAMRASNSGIEAAMKEECRSEGTPSNGKFSTVVSCSSGLRETGAGNAEPQDANATTFRVCTSISGEHPKGTRLHLTSSYSMTTLLSPQPISPVREVKLQNSVPMLMKALPPVPDSAGYNRVPSTGKLPKMGSSASWSPIQTKFRPSRSAFTSTDRSAVDCPTGNKEDQDKQDGTSHLKLPRMRVREARPSGTKPDPKHRESRPWNSEINYPWNRESLKLDLIDVQAQTPTPRKKFRLRVSRGKSLGSDTSTVRRRPSAHEAGLTENFANQLRKDLFRIPSDIHQAFRAASRKLSQEKKPEVRIRDASPPRTARMIPPNSAGKASGKDLHVHVEGEPEAPNEGDDRDASKHFSGLTNLFVRFSRRRKSARDLKNSQSHGTLRQSQAGAPVPHLTDPKQGEVIDQDKPLATSGNSELRRRVRGKLNRWFKHTGRSVMSRFRRGYEAPGVENLA